LAGVGLVLVIGGIWLISKGRGAETVGKIVVPFLNIPIGTATVSLTLVVLGLAATVYGLREMRKDNEDKPAKVSDARVRRIVGEPEPPSINQTSGKESEAAVLKWLFAYFAARIELDTGTDDGVRSGDYLVAIPDRQKAEDLPPEDLGNLQDEATALLKVARAYPATSTTQLDSYAYEAAFRGIPDDAPPAELFKRAAPVRRRQAVVAIPDGEARAHAGIASLGERAAKAKSSAERRILNDRLIEEAEAFLVDYPTGYFAADAIFERGGAEFELGECRRAQRTFEGLVDRFPFHPSAPGAREKAEKAQRCVERNQD